MKARLDSQFTFVRQCVRVKPGSAFLIPWTKSIRRLCALSNQHLRTRRSHVRTRSPGEPINATEIFSRPLGSAVGTLPFGIWIPTRDTYRTHTWKKVPPLLPQGLSPRPPGCKDAQDRSRPWPHPQLLYCIWLAEKSFGPAHLRQRQQPRTPFYVSRPRKRKLRSAGQRCGGAGRVCLYIHTHMSCSQLQRGGGTRHQKAPEVSVSRGGGRGATKASQSAELGAAARLESAASRVPGPAGLFSSARHGLQGNPPDRFQRTRCQPRTGESPGLQQESRASSSYMPGGTSRRAPIGLETWTTPSSGVYPGMLKGAFWWLVSAKPCSPKGGLCGLGDFRVAQSG